MVTTNTANINHNFTNFKQCTHVLEYNSPTDLTQYLDVANASQVQNWLNVWKPFILSSVKSVTEHLSKVFILSPHIYWILIQPYVLSIIGPITQPIPDYKNFPSDHNPPFGFDHYNPPLVSTPAPFPPYKTPFWWRNATFRLHRSLMA
jgi:hypothetical protein